MGSAGFISSTVDSCSKECYELFTSAIRAVDRSLPRETCCSADVRAVQGPFKSLGVQGSFGFFGVRPVVPSQTPESESHKALNPRIEGSKI